MIVDKIWGSYEDIIRDKKYVVKFLNIEAGKEISLQFHRERFEFWLVVEGEGWLRHGLEYKTIVAGDVVQIKPYEIHKVGCYNHSSMKILELQYGTCDEKDIFRLDENSIIKQQRLEQEKSNEDANII